MKKANQKKAYESYPGVRMIRDKSKINSMGNYYIQSNPLKRHHAARASIKLPGMAMAGRQYVLFIIKIMDTILDRAFNYSIRLFNDGEALQSNPEINADNYLDERTLEWNFHESCGASGIALKQDSYNPVIQYITTSINKFLDHLQVCFELDYFVRLAELPTRALSKPQDKKVIKWIEGSGKTTWRKVYCFSAHLNETIRKNQLGKLKKILKSGKKKMNLERLHRFIQNKLSCLYHKKEHDVQLE